MKIKTILLLNTLLIFALTAPAVALSQSGSLTQKKEEESTPVPKDFKTVILDVKHRDPQTLANVLQILASGEKHASVRADRGFKIITVRDHPENIANIEAALKRLDVPEPPPQPMPPPVNLEAQLHLIAASRAPGEKGALPAGLEPVINQLQSTLKYGSYRYITTFLSRVTNGGNIETSGVTDSLFPQPASSLGKTYYQYSLNNVTLISDTSGEQVIRVPKFRFGTKVPINVGAPGGTPNIQYTDIGINTDLNLREGDLVVVGTANISSSDEAIIVVVSVKKVK